MAWQLKKTVAVADKTLEVEDAETLVDWLLETPNGKVNLKDNEYMHTAVAQVLIASGVVISVTPSSASQQQILQKLRLI
ncbi:hypothetical protein [Salinibius halmophilus]|uniref:hypothetical protein n=1 Tax=Salinibius halmophilus TaxID=1853216 RepID=UPI000E666218|nr:hypothetical protein [Salinibius halmophilus]